jgi:broad specificity phosphatase PhoE
MHPEEQPNENASRKDYYRLLKRVMNKWMSNELVGDIPETWTEFEDRVKAVLSWLQKNQAGKKILAVSSGGAISMAIARVLKAPDETVIELNLQQKNSGYAHFYFNERSIRLTGMNHSPHLDIPERLQHLTFS